jgi:hypothetical protein
MRPEESGVEWSGVEGRMCASSKRQGPVAYMAEKEKLYGELLLLFLPAQLILFKKQVMCHDFFFVAKFTIFSNFKKAPKQNGQKLKTIAILPTCLLEQCVET